MSNRKRKGRRERAHMNYMKKCHAHERAVARKVRFERAMKHRWHLVSKLHSAEAEIRKATTDEPTRKVSFPRRLLGRRA